MKRYLVILMIAAMSVSAFAVDRAGQSDSLTRGNFITACYAWITPIYAIPSNIIDSASLRTAINEALFDISVNYIDAVQRKDTIATSAKVTEYSLNSDCIEPMAVLWRNRTDTMDISLDFVDYKQIGKRSFANDNTPKYWALFGNKLIIDPCPNAGDTIFIRYRARSNNLSSDTTTTNVKSKYKNLAVRMALVSVLSTKSGSLADRLFKMAEMDKIKFETDLAPFKAVPVDIRPDIK